MRMSQLVRLTILEAVAASTWEAMSVQERATYVAAHRASRFAETAEGTMVDTIKPIKPIKPAVPKKPRKPSKPKAAKPAKPAVVKPHKPAVVKPPKPAGAKPTTPKKAFNASVHKHFSTGRTLSAEHRKAISEGLKRWHAAHGRGKYTNRERNHAIRHINRHLTNRADHHKAMASHYKVRAAEHKRKGNVDAAARMHARAASHMQKHKMHQGLIRHLPQPFKGRPKTT